MTSAELVLWMARDELVATRRKAAMEQAKNQAKANRPARRARRR
jgi:hypothetical protein